MVVDDLAEFLHKLWCDADHCSYSAWDETSEYYKRHHEYYQQRAKSIYDQLEPEIGAFNVALACKVILTEFS